MEMETIERNFRDKVCAEVNLVSEGRARYRVSTPFQFDDGDHLVIVLKLEGEQWVLSDEGHTYMHLTYSMDEASLQRGRRRRIIANTLSAFSVEDREGELRVRIKGSEFGDALYDLVQALLKISDVTFLSRERVRSTFMEDFRAFMSEHVPERRRQFDWHHPVHDPEGRYVVDCRINTMPRPLFVFALPNDNRVQIATITLLNFELWTVRFRSLGIFEKQEEVNPKVLARYSDVSQKQFSSLSGNRDRIRVHLAEILGGSQR